MKNFQLPILYASLSLLAFAACKDEETTFVPHSTLSITVDKPETVLSVEADTFTFKNLSSLVESKVPAQGKEIRLPVGFYNCSYKAKIHYQNGEVISEGILQGLKESIQVTNNATPNFTLNTYIFDNKEDFIIEEIFFTGTLRSTGTQYYGDGYVKIYNNTDKVLYADGIALLESKFLSVQKYDYEPDIKEDTFTVHAVYVIPGNGTDYPVPPGKSLTICDTGIDHRNANPNSFDLSEASFEWYDQSNSPSNMDIDSETVPNLDKYYCYTYSFWVLHNRGFKSYAIARMKVDKNTYLKDYFYQYKYVIHVQGGIFPMTQEAYKIPNSWILDGVNCSVEPERVWNILPPSVDAGWTHCGLMDADKDRYFKSVRRKMLYVDDNGRRILKDSNNSTEDFNTETIPSIIEEQRSAISADGTKATVVTYDGVQPVSN
ncbi:MAG: DUF4876 domain-containing protein [Dysgonamonadaceae bacterium]|jgi:hypothetical protein|nr:DUF4876 domain-containing protein [Dysgonamonadaceae bacterium]